MKNCTIMPHFKLMLWELYFRYISFKPLYIYRIRAKSLFSSFKSGARKVKNR